MQHLTIEGSLAPGGPHHRLAALVGEWEGVTRTWFEPDKLADESPCRGTIRAILDGRFVLHEYAGTLQGKPLEGVAIYGFNLDKQRYEAAWVDSFHMGTAIMFSAGQPQLADPESPNVRGSYDDPTGGPPWGWRTTIELRAADHLVITAYNITPDGQEAKAVETDHRRRD